LLSFFHIESGGAIYSNAQNLYLINCYFINNTAYDGGAIFVHKNPLFDNQTLVINQCIFVSNQAGDIGGAVAVDQSILVMDGVISNSFFTKNDAWCTDYFYIFYNFRLSGRSDFYFLF